jgi:hypothetical protein
MARKTLTVTIDAPGRDQGKVFTLREMPASQAEKWAARALLALARSGVEIPDNIASAGLAGIAYLGIKAFAGLRFDDAEPLLDEMFRCITFVPDPMRPNIVRGLIEDDIEEVATRIKLRAELFTLHTGFSFPAANSTSTPEAAGKTGLGLNT